jgi:hypothetical protein
MFPQSCYDHYISGARTSGVYSIDRGGGLFKVYCDMSTSGGGWDLVSSVVSARLQVRCRNAAVLSDCAFGLYLQTVPSDCAFGLCFWAVPLHCAFRALCGVSAALGGEMSRCPPPLSSKGLSQPAPFMDLPVFGCFIVCRWTFAAVWKCPVPQSGLDVLWQHQPYR